MKFEIVSTQNPINIEVEDPAMTESSICCAESPALDGFDGVQPL